MLHRSNRSHRVYCAATRKPPDFASVDSARHPVARPPGNSGWRRDMAGLWFEQLEVGQLFRHAMRRTVTEKRFKLIANTQYHE